MDNQYSLKINVLNELLNNRLAVYPLRDESYIKLNDGLKEFAHYLLETTDFNGFQPDPANLQEAEKFHDYPIFICGAMKSGTTLCIRLLDNHPDLIVMPGDSHFHDHLNNWDRSQFTDISVHWINRLINPTGAEPYWFLGPDEKSFRQFLQYLYYYLHFSQYEIYICVVMAIYAVSCKFDKPIPKKYWVEKTPNNELNAFAMKVKYPHAKFLHVVRDPLNNIAALKKQAEIRQWDSSPLQIARSLRKLFAAARNNIKELGKNTYYVFRYEQLTSNPKAAMGEICEFLDIPFNENILNPTENGRPTTANSMFADSRVTGKVLDQSQSKRYTQQLCKKEIRDIVTTLYKDAIEFGYDWNLPEIKKYRMTAIYILFRRIFLKIKKPISRNIFWV